jgi:isoquinoline 1-oxidoreductase beta subunit
MDVRIDGMLTALVARAPRFGATVATFDATAATAVPGVRHVVQVPSGIAVVADDFWAAKRGRDALMVEWTGGYAHQDAELLRALREAAGTVGAIAATGGDAAAALEKAAARHEFEYVVPYLAHAPMEPLNCTVRFADGKCDVWTGTQFQTLDQQMGAKVFGIDPNQVEIHTAFLGGGFGRRATPTSDFVTEALHVAKAVGGPPVKTVWTREDDIRGGYYRPMTLHRIHAGTGADGKPVAWDHAIAGQSIAAGTPFEPMMVKDGVDGTSVEGAADSPYLAEVADRRVHLHSPTPGIPVLWWRSVGHSHTAFAMESAIDELAHAARADPVEYRRKLLAGHARHLDVLNLAAGKADWGKPPPAGRARGIAVHESFGSFIAQVAEVSVESGAIRVHRVVCAIDCGIAVNPEGIAAQMESGIAYGLSAALHGRLTFVDGRVRESNFHDYPVLRMNGMPRVEVHIVQSTERSGGAGEPGVPPVAPAVANAVFALTGQRLRELPLALAPAEAHS